MRVVRLLRRPRPCDGHVALGIRAGNRRVLGDLGDVVDTEVLDCLVVVGEVLHVERDDLEAHARQVRIGVRLHHVRELLPVKHHLLRVHLSDDFAHVAFQHLLRNPGDVGRLGVEEVHRRKVDLRGIAPDLDVHDRIDIDVDEVRVRHGLGRLHVDLDELQRDLVEPFEERNADVRRADHDAALQAGNDVRHVRRRLHVGDGNEKNQQHGGNADDDGGDRHISVPFWSLCLNYSIRRRFISALRPLGPSARCGRRAWRQGGERRRSGASVPSPSSQNPSHLSPARC